jgi:phosphoglycolate phosphatase-like HAD superfamily hydrolase
VVIRNIIFDWSGTLVDDLPAVLEATNQVLARGGVPPFTLEKFRAEFALPFTGFYQKHVPQLPFDEIEECYHSQFNKSNSLIKLQPHAGEFLEFCRANSLRLFVLSTLHKTHFEEQVRRLGLESYFEAVYVEIMDKRQKIVELLQRHQLQPKETLFVGDMQHDIETARHGGLFSCAVLTGYNKLQQLRVSHPDLIVEHLGELREIMDETRFSAPYHHRRETSQQPVATVGAVIFDEDKKKVLMIRTQKWSNLWGIPGGKIKYGESSVDALHREIKEETDLDVDGVEFVLVQDCIHSNEFYKPAHFLLLNYTCVCRGPANVHLNEEAQEFAWVTFEEGMKMQLNTPTRVLLERLASRGSQNHG